MKFSDLGLNEQLLEAIGHMGFENATPIQEQAIPVILGGHDLIGCAQTGTGKTAAFLLPILHRLAENPSDKTNTLIICPTRELAIQIDQQIEGLSYFTGVDSMPIYGGGDGADWNAQKAALEGGTNVIVATPGKLLSHLKMKNARFENLDHLILDEADRMLDIGFQDDILQIINFLPKERQNLLFSATMAPKIRQFASRILKDPKEISLAIAKPAEGVLQAAYLAHDEHKTKLIEKLISDKESYQSIIVFAGTKKKVSDIVRQLRRAGLNAKSISSSLEQEEREAVLLKFKNKKVRILVATDVISRGIDIKDIELVINYDVPKDAADYVHRVGRTARAATTGVAITLINENDMYSFAKIEELIERKVNKIATPEEIGPSPEWREPKQRKGGGNRNRNRKGGGKKRYYGKKKGGNNHNNKKKD